MVKHYPQPQTSERLSSDFRPKAKQEISPMLFILQGIAERHRRAARILYAVFANKETVCLKHANNCLCIGK